MKSTITNAAEITVLEPIDNNYKTGGGDISVGGCLVVASKGKPFTPMAVYGGTTNLEDKFGSPLPKKAMGMEGLRHVHDAAEECSYVNVVRVVNALGYRFPSLTFLIAYDSEQEWADAAAYTAGMVVSKDGQKWLCATDHTATAENAPSVEGGQEWLPFTGHSIASTHRYDEAVVVEDGAFMTLYPIDGDESKNRRIQIWDVDSEAKRFTIKILDKDAMGEDYVLESHIVGVDEDDTDDMGMSAYAETVLERDSSLFRCDFLEGTTWEQVEPVLKAVESTRVKEQDFCFEGGTSGGDPTISDWQLGVNVFRNERIALNLLFAAGIYEPDVIVSLDSVANERHLPFFYDVPPQLKYAEAIAWNSDIGLKSRHARAYYSPYSANDQWRGGKTVWGVSGAMAAAKARCNKIVTVGSTPGVHYAPAGENRGYLSRTGLAQLFPEDLLNRDALYEARINPVVPLRSGGCGADDDLTQWFKTNYLRFGWINDVLDYIDHRFYEGASQVKHEPDGLTKTALTNMMVDIMEQLVTSGALVTPRDPDRDGISPYELNIEQLEIDLWKVTWSVCITGAARRIVGQPKLIK